MGGLNHATFTACVGGALGYARQMQMRRKRVVPLLLGFGIAIGLHSFFNFVIILLGMVQQTYDRGIMVLFTLALVANYIPPLLAQSVLGLVFFKSLVTQRSEADAVATVSREEESFFL